MRVQFTIVDNIDRPPPGSLGGTRNTPACWRRSQHPWSVTGGHSRPHRRVVSVRSSTSALGRPIKEMM